MITRLTPFIEAPCELLSSEEAQKGETDFLPMLTFVQRKVAIGFTDES